MALNTEKVEKIGYNHTMKPLDASVIKFNKIYAEGVMDLYSKDYFTERYIIRYLKEDIPKGVSYRYQRKIKENIQDLNNDYRSKSTVSFMFKHCAKLMIDRGVYQRIMTNDPMLLVRGLYTYGRMEYLHNIVKPFEDSHSDCAHANDVIDSLAANDKEVIQAYITNIPGPAKVSCFGKILANCLYTAIKDDINNYSPTFEAIKKYIKSSDASKYDTALLEAVQAIILRDKSAFSQALEKIFHYHNYVWRERNELLNGHGINFQAHGLFNLARAKFEQAGLGPPDEPDNPHWDSGYYHALLKIGDKPRSFVVDIAAISPVMEKWLTTLPGKLDIEELFKDFPQEPST